MGVRNVLRGNVDHVPDAVLQTNTENIANVPYRYVPIDFMKYNDPRRLSLRYGR